MKHFITSSLSLAIVCLLSCQATKAQTKNEETLALHSDKQGLTLEKEVKETESNVLFSADRKKNHILMIKSSQKGKMTIVDESDEILYQQPIQEGTNEIKLQSLESGKYKVKVKDEKGKLYRTRLTYVKVN